jgi:hypothetical protein
MENQDAANFVERQIDLNKKFGKTLNGFVNGLETQATFNRQITEHIVAQDNRIDTLNRIVVALVTFVSVILCGILIIVVRINS